MRKAVGGFSCSEFSRPLEVSKVLFICSPGVSDYILFVVMVFKILTLYFLVF